MNARRSTKPLPVIASTLSSELLTRDTYLILQPYLEYQQHPAGSELWQEGDSGNDLVMILSGRLELLKETEFPGRPFLLGLFSAGSLVGEEGLLVERPRQGTVRALEASETLSLNRENFGKLDREQPAIANLILRWLLNLLSGRLRSTQQRLATIF